MAFLKESWEESPAWRDRQQMCVAQANRVCVVCKHQCRSMGATPINRRDPSGPIVAICGACKSKMRFLAAIPISKGASELSKDFRLGQPDTYQRIHPEQPILPTRIPFKRIPTNDGDVIEVPYE